MRTKIGGRFGWLVLVVLLPLMAVTAASAQAITYRSIDVDNVDDKNPMGGCTLREAIYLANLGAEASTNAFGTQCAVSESGSGSAIIYAINLPSAPYIYTLSGMPGNDDNSSGDLDINSAYPVVITGDVNTPDRIIIQAGTTPANGIDRVFDISQQNTVTLEDMTIRHGSAINSNGGGIWNGVNATLSVTNSTLSNNCSAGNGGGINNYGALSLSNSALSQNSSVSNGGGIYNNGGNSTVSLANSTLSENSAGYNGGGIYNDGTGTINLTDSTLSENYAIIGGGIWNSGSVSLLNNIIANSDSWTDCENLGLGSITVFGVNLVEDGSCPFSLIGDPNLGPLQNNGGLTETHALLPSIPAIDAGGDSAAPATDQRGGLRPQGAASDLGAYECAP